MPKANDDESEFETQVYEKLAKLTWQERLLYLISNLRLVLPVLFSVAALSFSFFTILELSRAPKGSALNPLAQIGERLSAQAVTIHRANETIRAAAELLPASEQRDSILKQQRIIEEEAVALKAYGDGWNDRGKRSYFEFVSTAYAQATSPRISVEEVRLYGIISILVTLGIAFVLCIGIILFSDHAKRLTFAFDTVKVLMGFFVGVATSFFGVR